MYRLIHNSSLLREDCAAKLNTSVDVITTARNLIDFWLYSKGFYFHYKLDFNLQ